MPPGEFICPTCRAPLTYPENPSGEFRCAACQVAYNTQSGILDFTPHAEFYWGKIDPKRLILINQVAATEGWYQALRQCASDLPPLIQHVAEPARLGWLPHCYDETANLSCLDLGSGWGALAFGLSRFYRTVYSVDGALDHLRFQSLRAAQSEINNLRLIKCDLRNLPLPDSSQDLVAMNGILEWVSLSYPGENPTRLQQALLNEAFRVLKPHGRLFLGTANRLGFLTILGLRENPFANPGVAIQNPMAANTTRLHSVGGYTKLMRKAGFARTDTYWVWPSSSYPRLSGSAQGDTIRTLGSILGNLIDNRWARLVIRSGLRLPKGCLGWLAKQFTQNYIFVSSKQPVQPSLQKDILAAPAPQTGVPLPDASFARLTLATRPSILLRTTYLIFNHAGISHSVRVYESENHARGNNKFTYTTTAGIEGRSLRPHNLVEVRAAAKWLVAFQQRTHKGEWTQADLEQEMRLMASPLNELSLPDETKSLLSSFVENYLNTVQCSTLPVVTEHGDFTPPNILMEQDGEINVLDWEYSRESGNPLLDVGAFCLSLLRRQASKNKFHLQVDPKNPAYCFMLEYGAHLKVPIHLAPAYYVLRWIQRIQADKTSDDYTVDLAMHTCIPLLRPSLEYGLAMGRRETIGI